MKGYTMTKEQAEQKGWVFTDESDGYTTAEKGQLINMGKLSFVLLSISMVEGSEQMDQEITVYGYDSEAKFLSDIQLHDKVTKEALDLFGNEWRNKGKWIADRLKVLNYENDLQKMVGGHLDFKVQLTNERGNGGAYWLRFFMSAIRCTWSRG